METKSSDFAGELLGLLGKLQEDHEKALALIRDQQAVIERQQALLIEMLELLRVR